MGNGYCVTDGNGLYMRCETDRRMWDMDKLYAVTLSHADICRRFYVYASNPMCARSKSVELGRMLCGWKGNIGINQVRREREA